MINNSRMDKNSNQKLEGARLQWQEDQQNLLLKVRKKYSDINDLEQLLKLQPNASAGQIDNNQLLAWQDETQFLLDEYELLWAEEKVVEELNKHHAIVHTDQFYILTEKDHQIFGGIDFNLESKQSFKSLYEPYSVMCWDGKPRPKAEIWLKSPQRRAYKGITFDPAKPGEVNGYYNLWKGFKKEPVKGDASKYWQHVQENICSDNEAFYIFVRKWLAHVFQRPNEVHTALVLCGSQGVGKNRFVEPLGILLGPHYVLLSSMQELVSNFNFHLKNAVIIHANEALWGGHRKDIGTVKAMITEQTCLIEGKGKDRIMVKNFKHLILSSNEDWPVHLDRDDRRFFVLQVSERHKGDHPYFAAIVEELENGGYEALLYDLLNEDLSGFSPRTFPQSKAAFAIKMLGEDSPARYLFQVLQEGHFCIGEDRLGTWQSEIPKTLVYKDYTAWCRANGEKELTNQSFGMSLHKLLSSVKNGRAGSGISRATTYKLPELDQAREEFSKAFKESPDIFHDDK